MIKRLIALALIALTILALSGCTTPFDPDAARAACNDVLTAFKNAVQDYRVGETLGVRGMLDCLSGSDFTLYIQEGADDPYSKGHDTLVVELYDVFDQEYNWREEHGYYLNLILSDVEFSNITSSGAEADMYFEVWEGATGTSVSEDPPVDETQTAGGAINCRFEPVNGKWLISEMTINYYVQSVSLSRGETDYRNGFGFDEGYDYISISD